MYKLTWSRVYEDDSIDCIEHPLSGCLMPKEQFANEFKLLLQEFDGTTSSDYFDFYFCKCPLYRQAYKFRDNDAKEDFLDACMDLNIIPTMKEILQGETKEDQAIRRAKSSEDLTNDFKKLKTKEMSEKYHAQTSIKHHKKQEYKSKAQQIQHTYETLMSKLETCDNPQDKKKLEDKLNRVIGLMEHSF